jgi:hypothetical protein
MRSAPALVLVAAAGVAQAQAQAQALMTPEAFEAMAVGRTLHFEREGVPFGSERYLPGQRTLWQFDGGLCVAGRWRVKDGAFCFAYEGEPAEHCWFVRSDGEALSAHLLQDGFETGFVIELDRVDSAPLDCPNPGVAALSGAPVGVR